MDGSFYLFTGLICVALGALLGYLAFTSFRRFKKINDIFKNESEFNATATGSISKLEEVRRRNRSFRWVNEYPIVTYTVDGKLYNESLEYAEKRRGHYQLGGSYCVHYKPSDPSDCLVEEFRKQMKSYRTQSVINGAILAFFTFNVVVSGFSYIVLFLTGAV